VAIDVDSHAIDVAGDVRYANINAGIVSTKPLSDLIVADALGGILA
jgi:hypothetical protein